MLTLTVRFGLVRAFVTTAVPVVVTVVGKLGVPESQVGLVPWVEPTLSVLHLMGAAIVWPSYSREVVPLGAVVASIN